MNWIKIKDIRINLSNVKFYEKRKDVFRTNPPDFSDNYGIYKLGIDNFDIVFDTEEERDEELRKLDEALEKGLHTINEFKLP